MPIRWLAFGSHEHAPRHLLPGAPRSPIHLSHPIKSAPPYISAQLHPLDMLNLSRASKFLRSVMLFKGTKSAWIASLASVHDLYETLRVLLRILVGTLYS